VVWVVDGAGSSAKVRQVEVALGVVSGDRVQVKGEIKPGHQVVIQGNERLRSGQAVSVIESKSQPNTNPAQGKPTNSTARR
jgi:multidrug efflux pump subunit AcrA (membrane-fusion protein)